MIARGKLIYKSLEIRSAGAFKNAQGENVEYGETYLLKADEILDGSINERKLKVDKNNLGLVNQLRELKPYSEIELECEVKLYQNSCKLIPVRLISNSNNK